MPHEEVRDHFYQCQNYLHALTLRLEDHGPRCCGCTTATWPVQAGSLRYRSTHRHIDLVTLCCITRHDLATNTLEISSHLSPGQQVFKMAAECWAYLEFGDHRRQMVTDGKLTSAVSDAGPRPG